MKSSKPDFKYLPTGRGEHYIKDGEFIVTSLDALHLAATEFVKVKHGSPRRLDGHECIKIIGEDAGVSHTSPHLGWPRAVKFLLMHDVNGPYAHIAYSYDHVDLSQMQSNLLLGV